MNVIEIKSSFRTPAAADYPELQGCSRVDVYDGKMGPGGLYLATQMARRLCLDNGQRVLDIGCGQGAASAFLAKQFGVSVVAVDLWISATTIFQRLQQHGLEDRIVPLNLDITCKLPFATEYFDAVFCMDSVHYYGGTLEFWNHLLPHLKPGGRLCLGSPCFNAEFSAEALQGLPTEYDDGTNLWPKEFSRYHSPAWWATLLQETGCVDVLEAKELDDGIIFWEDDVLCNLEQGGSNEEAGKDSAQIAFRNEGMPHLTHFVLCAVKKARPNTTTQLPGTP